MSILSLESLQSFAEDDAACVLGFQESSAGKSCSLFSGTTGKKESDGRYWCTFTFSCPRASLKPVGSYDAAEVRTQKKHENYRYLLEAIRRLKNCNGEIGVEPHDC